MGRIGYKFHKQIVKEAKDERRQYFISLAKRSWSRANVSEKMKGRLRDVSPHFICLNHVIYNIFMKPKHQHRKDVKVIECTVPAPAV